MILAPPDFELCPCPHGQRCCCDTPNIPYESYVPTYAKALKAVRPRHVMEWGPGKNTDMALAYGAHVQSIESKTQYLHAPHQRLSQECVPEQSDKYVKPDSAQLYFVDGRRRAECLRALGPLLYSAVAVLHDANRQRYWDALSAFSYVLVPDGTTAYVTDDADYFIRLLVAMQKWVPWRQYAYWQEIPVAERRA